MILLVCPNFEFPSVKLVFYDVIPHVVSIIDVNDGKYHQRHFDVDSSSLMMV